MIQKVPSFYFLKYCLFFTCSAVFAQTEIHKTAVVFNDFKSENKASSFAETGDAILFNAANDSIYCLQKNDGTIRWKMLNEGKKEARFYQYADAFFYGQYENSILKATTYNLQTGKKEKELPFELVYTKPYFIDNVFYATVLADGGKLIACSLKEDRILWETYIGDGVELQPIYSKKKIIASAGDDYWFEMGYDGKVISTKAKPNFDLDTTKIVARKYKFLTHDGKEIIQDFVKKNKLSNSEYKFKTTAQHTFILSEKQLLILGNNKKKIVNLDLETIVPTADFYWDDYFEILEMNAENVWFYIQGHLINYDFKNKKLLRKTDLTKWNAQQLALENRTIWLLSNNDGQFYKLDFEPDERTAAMLEFKAKMDFERHRCYVPDPKKIALMKAMQEEHRSKNESKN